MPSPTGGTKTNRAKIIAAVVRRPSFELPGPASKIFHDEFHTKVILVETDDYQRTSVSPLQAFMEAQSMFINKTIWSLGA